MSASAKDPGAAARPEITRLLPDLLEPPPPVAPRAPRRRLGEILRALRTLSDADIERIEQHRSEQGLLFGQAAVALSLTSPDDVAWALSQQFHYAWAREGALLEEPALVMAREPFSPQAEAFRDLRAQLMADTRLVRRPLAVVGAEPGVGRSHCAANLAIAFSQLGARTLLIDGDLRRPQQHRLFGLSARLGLADLLADRGVPGVLQRVPELPDLYLIAAGAVPPNPVELLQSLSFGRLMAEVVESFDHVVIDTPAAQHSADARVIAGACAAAVVVGRRHRSGLKAMQQLVAGVTRTGALVAGVVMAQH